MQRSRCLATQPEAIGLAAYRSLTPRLSFMVSWRCGTESAKGLRRSSRATATNFLAPHYRRLPTASRQEEDSSLGGQAMYHWEWSLAQRVPADHLLWAWEGRGRVSWNSTAHGRGAEDPRTPTAAWLGLGEGGFKPKCGAEWNRIREWALAREGSEDPRWPRLCRGVSPLLPGPLLGSQPSRPVAPGALLWVSSGEVLGTARDKDLKAFPIPWASWKCQVSGLHPSVMLSFVFLFRQRKHTEGD